MPINKVFSFWLDLGSIPLSKGSGTSIKTRNYTRPGSCIKTALPQATVTSLVPVNGDVVYPTVTSPAALGSKSVFLRRPIRTPNLNMITANLINHMHAEKQLLNEPFLDLVSYNAIL